MTEFTEVKNDVSEIKADVKNLTKCMGDLQVLVAGNYVTRGDFCDHQKENRGDHNRLWGSLITLAIFIIGLIIKIIMEVPK